MPAITINIFILKINAITASSVNIGQAVLADYHVGYKSNQGYGANYGDESSFIGTNSAVDDRDIMDSNQLIEPADKLLKDVLR